MQVYHILEIARILMRKKIRDLLSTDNSFKLVKISLLTVIISSFFLLIFPYRTRCLIIFSRKNPQALFGGLWIAPILFYISVYHTPFILV